MDDIFYRTGKLGNSGLVFFDDNLYLSRFHCLLFSKNINLEILKNVTDLIDSLVVKTFPKVVRGQ